MTAAIGTTLGGRYRLDERIASGGMGDVWRARDEQLDRTVAVKVLKHEYSDDASFVERFRNESKHAAVVTHPGIATVHDFGQDDGIYYLVLELVEGEALSALLTREGRLSADQTLQIVEGTALALDAAHGAGVVHRDVTPGNILITPTGAVKVTDFGIARAADALPITQTGMVIGTAHYLSPEQSAGRPVTPASDVYSLGVVAYECLAGHRPFDSGVAVNIALAHLNDEPPPMPDDVPDSARKLVLQAMAKRPEERFMSAAAFADAAASTRESLRGSSPTTATTVMPIAAEADPSKRRAIAIVSGAVALALVAAALAAARDPAPPPTKPLASTSPTPTTIALPAGLIGLSYNDAVAKLAAVGLTAKRAYQVSNRRAGTVIDANPKTGLHRGATVTLTTAARPAVDNDDDDSKGDGNGSGKKKD